MDDDSGPYGLILTLILIVVLIAINAFFASAEMAVVSVNQNRLKRVLSSGDKRAEILKKLTSEPTRFLSTIKWQSLWPDFFQVRLRVRNYPFMSCGSLLQWESG